MKKVVILLNDLSEFSTEDEKDVLDQADEIEDALITMGYSAKKLFMGLNLEEISEKLIQENPDVVFNLVEGIDGKGILVHLAPSLLEKMHIPYTGCRLESMFLTSNKILTKKILKLHAIRTPDSFSGSDKFDLDPDKTYIVKPLWEDASIGITDRSVFSGKSIAVIDEFRERFGNAFFIEEYIDGREFNVSLLGGPDGPQVMPLAEMLFHNYPEDKPKIVSYAAKWHKDTFEYNNTYRTFEYDSSDSTLRKAINRMAMSCWDIFELKGYVRVDLRVDQKNVPYVLEVNANPCFEKGAGFIAACLQAGLSYKEVVGRIIYDACQ